MTNNFDKIKELSGIDSKLWKLTKQMNIFSLPPGVQNMIDTQYRISVILPKTFVSETIIPNFEFPDYKKIIPDFSKNIYYSSNVFESLKSISQIGEKISNNPEVQFSFITDLEILNLKSTEELKESLIESLADEKLTEKEDLLNKNLIPLLEELQLDNLWLGANYAIESSENPDKLRHCLISLRTILEYLIDDKLAPFEKIKNDEMFKSEFKKYHNGKQDIHFVKVSRSKKIKYFTRKFEYGFLEEFTQKDIQYICDCYSILCNVHQPNIGINESQVRSLKIKTGITIWLLCYLYKIQENFLS
ncbi:hypothetical protein [Chryseobacterium sp. RR2-3-20]|uniref:pPIWI-associating nuclease domain-containing protein n=1 Tax=Chryseobacterium sp. RR2-3-20 TaxID=2787626 RepID=UPI001FD74265|nr:hypothetical protein [Chryseobacterium sp. RR2-3-20]